MGAMPNWNTVCRRMEAFWAQEVADAPCVAIPVRAPGFTPRRFGGGPDASFEELWKTGGDPEKMLAACLSEFEAKTYCGDAFPSVFPDYGTLPHINAIQWTPVAGQPRTSDFMDVLQKIQRAGKGLVLLPRPDELDALMDGLSPEGVRIVLYDVASRDEAEQLLDKTKKWKRQTVWRKAHV